MSNSASTENAEKVIVRRFLAASPVRIFRAWTDPNEIKKWWGPEGVTCLSVEMDLRVGGQYRIENGLPDGSVLWISGKFEVIEKPHLLVYTWVTEGASSTSERVEIRFNQHESGTNVIITHERIETKSLREGHHRGWLGCLQSLVDYLTAGETPDV